jgi:hypothetical protein
VPFLHSHAAPFENPVKQFPIRPKEQRMLTLWLAHIFTREFCAGLPPRQKQKRAARKFRRDIFRGILAKNPFDAIGRE